MPKGVEHIHREIQAIVTYQVIHSLMPKGVEHKRKGLDRAVEQG